MEHAGRVDRLTAAVRDAAQRALDRGHWDEAAALARELLQTDETDAVAARILTAAEARGRTGDAEQGRRYLTVLFSDVVGSTPLSERLDPEDYLVAIAAYQDVVREAVAAHDGHVEQFQGDGVIAYFGYPVASEDDQVRAVEAGLEIVRAVGPAGARVGIELEARVGIHMGRTVMAGAGVAGRHQSAAVGFAANVAARVQSVARPGAVAVSAAVADAVAPFFELEDLGATELRGVSGELNVFEVRAPRARSTMADDRLAAPLVDRAVERAALEAAWSAARDGGEAERLVLLSGPPGIGKSRLVRHLADLVRADGATPIEINCGRSLRDVGLGAVRGGIEKALGLVSEAGADDLSAALHERAQLVELSAEATAVLELLLGETAGRGAVPELAPSRLRETIIGALLEWIAAEAALAPTALIVEDLHWADQTGVETIRRLTARPLPEGLAVLLTVRSGELPGTLQGLGSRALSVEALAEAETVEMVQALTGGSLEPDAVAALVRRSEGVPLFTEHLVMAAETTGGVAGEDELPATIEALLQARLDATGAGRGVAEVAAVIGREFSVEALELTLERLGPRAPVDPSGTRAGLRLLQRAGLVEAEGRDRMRFRHSLVRDAAYAMQLRSERPHRHRMVASACIALRGPDATPETLAYHHAQAGDLEPAAQSYLRAAADAAGLAEFDLARAHLRSATDLVPRIGGTAGHRVELAACMQLGGVFAASLSYAQPEAEEAYRRALELCDLIAADEGRDPDLDLQLVTALGGLWSKEVVAGDLPNARRVTDRLERLVTRSADLDPEVGRFTLGCRGLEQLYGGETDTAAKTLAAASMLGRAAPVHVSLGTPHDYVAAADALLSVALTLQGDDAGADEAIERALVRTQRLGFPVGPFSEAVVLVYVAYAQRLRRDVDAARATAQAVCDIGDRHGFQEHSMLGQILLLTAGAVSGDAMSCQALDGALGMWRMAGGGLAVPVLLTELADGLLRAGDTDRAAASLAEAASIMGVTEQRGSESEVVRLLALVDHRAGAADDQVVDRLLSAAGLALDQGAVRLAGRALDDVQDVTGGRLPDAAVPVGARFLSMVPQGATRDLRATEEWVSALA